MASFARYLLTAGTATCVDVAVVQTLLFLDVHHSLFFGLVILFGSLAGLTVNFALSRRFVFASDDRSAGQQFLSFVTVAAGGLGLRLLVAYTAMGVFGLAAFAWLATLPFPDAPERLAHLIAVGLVTIYSFIAHKHITFMGGFLSRLGARKAVVP